ncbi:MAG TPA: GNAT family N-acetyltransferase, partial [Thermodesulfobacteriota bacterium]|nr:GNAT family N-acetyltransferase [Thermodesulfobacteriota bacterium]
QRFDERQTENQQRLNARACSWIPRHSFRRARNRLALFFSFRFEGTEYVFNSGYDPAFARLSPGIVLTAYCVRSAIADGLKVYHFLRGSEDYKYRLGGKEEKIYRVLAVRE